MPEVSGKFHPAWFHRPPRAARVMRSAAVRFMRARRQGAVGRRSLFRGIFCGEVSFGRFAVRGDGLRPLDLCVDVPALAHKHRHACDGLLVA